MSTKEQTQRLFSYGTLQTDAVQISTFGRLLEGKPDALAAYRLQIITIEDQNFVELSGSAQHRNLQFTGDKFDCVEGTVFAVTSEELAQSDAYEPAGYSRVLAQLRSGIEAWVYLK